MSTFDISHIGLTTLKGVSFPKNVTKLYCSGNKLTSLEHCPASVTLLFCNSNQLTSLEHCPASVTYLYFNGNPLNNEYNGLSLIEIHKLNRKKSFQKGLGIIQKMVQNSMALKIQKKWWWWYDTMDGEGISRFCRRAVDELNDNIS